MSEYDKIKELIITNNFTKAINILSEVDKDGNHRAYIINIIGRIEYLKEKELKGFITNDEVTAKKNKLRSDLVQVLDLVFGKSPKKGSSAYSEALKLGNNSISNPSTENKSNKLTLTKTIISIITGFITIVAIAYNIHEYYSPKELTVFLQGSDEKIQYLGKKDSLEFYSPKFKIKLKSSISDQGRVDYLIPSNATEDKFKLILDKEGYNLYPSDSLYEFPSQSLWIKIHRLVNPTISEETSQEPESKPINLESEIRIDTSMNPTLLYNEEDSAELSHSDETIDLGDSVEKEPMDNPPVYYELTIMSSKKMGEIHIDGLIRASRGGYAYMSNLIKGKHHINIKNTAGEIIKDTKIDLQENTTIDIF